MIRSANRISNYLKRYGERRKIGRLARASFRVWNRIERFDPEGLRSPGGEQRFENRRGIPASDLATGDMR
jgi:hypothetical protein